MKRGDDLKKKLDGAKRELYKAKKTKKEYENYLKKLNEMHSKGEIPYSDYVEILHTKRDGRNIQEWIDYLTKHESKADKEVKKHQHKHIIKLSAVFVLSLLFVITLITFSSNSGLSINGFVTKNADIRIKQEAMQLPARIGETVRWEQKIDFSKIGVNKVYVPTNAANIKVTEYNENKINLPKLNIHKFNIFQNLIGKLTGNVIEEGVSDTVEFTVNNASSEYEVEYETPAPQIIEEIQDNKKEITIVGVENLEYSNITANSELMQETEKGQVELYVITEDSKEIVEIKEIDENNDGLVENIEWTIPTLIGTQKYELIIKISKAIHLDKDKEFISDIYDSVKELDNSWSEPINSEEYVRVTFERNLTNENDITIFPRVVQGNPIVQVYEKNETNLIAEFNPLIDKELNKIYLTNLQGEQDTFDLKILNGELEFDYIVDPFINFSTPGSTELESFMESIVKAPDGVMYLAMRSTSLDISISNSTNNGTTWSDTFLVKAGAVSNPNLIVNSSGSLFLIYMNLYNLAMSTLTPGGSWSEVVFQSSNATYRPALISATIDSNNNIHVCEVTTSWGASGSNGDFLIYYNWSPANGWYSSGNVTDEGASRVFNGTWISNDTADDVDWCDIEVDTNNNVYIIGSGSVQDDLDIWSSKDNFQTRYQINDSISDPEGDRGDLAINPVNNDLWISYKGIRLSVANTTTDNWNGVWTQRMIESETTGDSAIVVSADEDIFITYMTIATGNFSLSRANSSDYGMTWEYRTNLVHSLYPTYNWSTPNFPFTVRGRMFPTSDRVTDSIDYYYWNDTDDGVYFANYSIYYSGGADLTAPTVTIAFPSNNSNHSNTNLDVNYTATDAILIDSCWYSNDTYTVNTTLENCTTNITTIVWTEGQHNVTIWANDSSNNVGAGRISFTIDTIAPYVNITSPTNNSETRDINQAVNYTRTDLNLASCWYSNDSYIVNTTLTNCANLTSIVWTEGQHNITVWANDSAGNLNWSNVNFTVDSLGPVCTLISRTPTDIVENSTGVLNTIINCTDSRGVNITYVNSHYSFFITRTVDAFTLATGIPNYWSIRYPNNSLGITGSLTPPYSIWRALGRNEGYWYDTLTTMNTSCQGISPCYNILNDTFSYAIEDGEYGHFVVTPENSANTSVIINYTHPAVDVSAFRQVVYLSWGSMTRESKKNMTIKKGSTALVKGFDPESYRSTANYSANLFVNLGVVGTPARTLRVFYCNNTYDPLGAVEPINSINCVLANTLTSTQISQKQFTEKNSTYIKADFSVIDGIFGGIKTTREYYLAFESQQVAPTAYYQLAYANESTNTDVRFNDTRVAWNSTNEGLTWNQAPWTPDMFVTFTRSSNDDFELGYYTTDMLGNPGYNFTLFRDEITYTNHPISFPVVLEYNSTTRLNDENLNETHKGVINVLIGTSKDPDSSGNVTHNLTLNNLDGSLNYTINTSFKSAADADIWIDFNSALVLDGIYKMNITAYAGDDVLDVKSRITYENITIDNTAPNINITSPTNNSIITNNTYSINYTRTDLHLASCWYSNDSYAVNTTLTNCANITSVTWAQGPHNVTIWANDSAGNLNWSRINFSISIPDAIGPTVTIAFPSNNSNHSNTNLDVNYTATDDVSLDVCWYSNDSYAVNTTWENCTTNLTEIIWVEGQHNVTIWANDSSNNIGAGRISFTIDTIAPYVNITYPTNNSIITNINDDINYTRTDANLAYCWYSNDSYSVNTSLSTCENITSIVWAEGAHDLTIWANDSAGNLNWSRINFSVTANNAPVILNVQNSTASVISAGIGLNAGPSATYIEVNFTAYDADGNLNDTQARVNISKSGETTRVNSSCAKYESSTYNSNYTCNVTMWWFDGAGAWIINVSIADLDSNFASNSSANMSVGLTTGFEIGPTSLNWTSMSVGSTNKTSGNDPLIINNTGNKPIGGFGALAGTGNISINATSLKGETNSNYAVHSGNFSVSYTTGGASCTGAACLECAGETMSTTSGHYTNVTSINLTKGNFTADDRINGQEELYFCIKMIGSELTSQAYSTSTDGAWTISILAIAMVTSLKKRKRKGDAEENKLLDMFGLITEELKNRYSLNKQELLKILIEKLREQYEINHEELLDAAGLEEEIKVPVSIFTKELGFLEALSKFLKENLKLNYKEIAQLLDRDERTIWTSYKKAKEKSKESFAFKKTDLLIPMSKLVNKDLTVLESLILYLKEKGISYSEIAKILNRDQRNIWTVYSRVNKKREKLKKKGDSKK